MVIPIRPFLSFSCTFYINFIIHLFLEWQILCSIFKDVEFNLLFQIFNLGLSRITYVYGLYFILQIKLYRRASIIETQCTLDLTPERNPSMEIQWRKKRRDLIGQLLVAFVLVIQLIYPVHYSTRTRTTLPNFLRFCMGIKALLVSPTLASIWK